MRALILSFVGAQLCLRAAWGATELLFANVTGSKRLSITQTCVNNNQSDPIAWITPVAAQFSQPIPVVNNARQVHFDWKSHGWTWTYFYHGFSDPVIDYSWEAFPIEYTEGTVANDQKPIYINAVVSLSVIHFSYMSAAGGHIYLCNANTPTSADCLVFTFNERFRANSVLRKCTNGTTPLTKCITLASETRAPAINRDRWNHIKIDNAGNKTLELLVNNATSLTYASNVADLYNYTRISVASFQPAFWKYHRYSMYHDNPPDRHVEATIDVRSRHLCLSFLTANSGNMSLELYAANDTARRRLVHAAYGFEPGTFFDYRTFYARVPSAGAYVVRLGAPDKTVNVRDVLVYDDCDGPVETHKHSSTLTHTQDVDAPVGVACTSLNANDDKLSLRPVGWRAACTSEECTTCNRLYGTTACPHRMACDGRRCYCSRGFKGDYCQQACTLANQTSPEPTVTAYADRVVVAIQLRCDEWNDDVTVFVSASCAGSTNTKAIVARDLADGFTELSLTPYTNYSLEVKKQSFRRVETLFMGNFTTKPASKLLQPHPVTFAEVYAKSTSSLSIRWGAPHPPTGELESFSVKYRYVDAAGEDGRKRALHSSSRCRVWTEMFCATLKDLRPGVELEVAIAAKNRHVASHGYETLLRDTTTIGAPDAPSNVRGRWDGRRFLLLEWQHPSRSNAPYVEFEGDVNGRQFRYRPQPNLTHTFNTSVRCRPENHYCNGVVRSANERHRSPLVPFHFSCPVFEPSFGRRQPTIARVTNHSLVVRVPRVQDAELDSSLYVILWTNRSSGGASGDCGKPMHRFLAIDDQACWTLARYARDSYARIADAELELAFVQLPAYDLRAEYFRAGVLIVNKYRDQTAHNWYNLQFGDAHVPATRFGNYWRAIALVAVCALLLGLAWCARRRSRTTDRRRAAGKELISLPSRERRERIASDAHFTDSDSSIPVDELHEYVKAAILADQLDAEYATNDYGVAYEPVRPTAKLRPRFVNADYIAVGGCARAYIAAKDPSEKTAHDFWSMLLDEGVRHIVTLTSMASIRKNKAKRYWPRVEGNEEIAVKDIRVAAVDEKRHYNFVKRTFLIVRGNVRSEVTQHHFLDWPGREAPIYPHSLLPFVKDILGIPHSAEHPILVHCSADVDRSGTIILIDVCLRQAMATRRVDVFGWLNDLRGQRSCLLNDVRQYKLVHLVVVEYFCPIRTAHSCATFAAACAALDDAGVERVLRHVDDSDWHERALRNERVVHVEVDDGKNRCADVYPNQYGVLYLIPRREGDSCYINAVSVDGFRRARRFVATQHPLRNTVDDFWRLAVGEDVRLLVALETDYDVAFWRRGGDFVTPDGTSVEHIEYQQHDAYVMHTLHAQLRQGKKKPFQLVEFVGWPVGERVPRRLASLLSLWKLVKDMKLADSKVLIMCRNGANACGLYIAMTNILDRMEDEQVVDVSMAVRIVRRSRRQFVTDIVQMKALYQLAALHLEEFKKYSNFNYN